MLPLTTNKCVYDFTGSEELFSILKELQFDCVGNLGAAERCVEKILEISNSLNFEAKDVVAEKWGAQLESAKEDLESAGRKRIEKRIEAAEKAEYLKLRSYFLSAIHTWFALVFQISCGSAEANTANPEILSKAIIPDSLDEKSAGKALGHAEKLLSDLNFNISEELAIRNFCLNVAMS
jgi:F0F1-type ATP synthase epsilon subunit